jgi:hypothetical protein
MFIAGDGVGAVLHVDPDDDPYAGTTTPIVYYLKTKDREIEPSQCYCTLEIIHDGKQIAYLHSIKDHNKDAAHNTNKGVSFAFSFPKKGIYKLVLRGDPKGTNEFEPFYLEYTLRVVREKSPEGGSSFPSDRAVIWTGAIAAAFGLTYVLVRKKVRKTVLILLVYGTLSVCIASNRTIYAFQLADHQKHNATLDETASDCANDCCTIPFVSISQGSIATHVCRVFWFVPGTHCPLFFEFVSDRVKIRSPPPLFSFNAS